MSFILDALRKSEHERQRGAVPGLSEVPFAAPRRAPPYWALALIVVLGVAVLALGGAWWRSTRTIQGAAATESPAARTEIPREPAASPEPVGRVPESTSLQIAPPPVARVPAPEPEVQAAAQSSAPPLSSAAALAAEGIFVPALHLELHAYSERAAERFVFINGKKYSEGQTLAEGPRLVAIEPNGAVLSQQGRRFLLVAE